MMLAQISLDDFLTGPPPEPCVNCDDAAAPRWLLCLPCVARLDEPMLLALARKHGELERWLVDAEEFLRDLPPSDARFAVGWEQWRRKLRVYERIVWLGRAVKEAV